MTGGAIGQYGRVGLASDVGLELDLRMQRHQARTTRAYLDSVAGSGHWTWKA